jgi:hypothetical protein
MEIRRVVTYDMNVGPPKVYVQTSWDMPEDEVVQIIKTVASSTDGATCKASLCSESEPERQVHIGMCQHWVLISDDLDLVTWHMENWRDKPMDLQQGVRGWC